MSLDSLMRVAETLLYEGYLLYPYRASAQKNQIRWQFGVAMPWAWVELDQSERSVLRAECLIEPAGEIRLEVLLRYLHVRHREGDGAGERGWDEAVERSLSVCVRLDAAPDRHRRVVEIPVREPAEKETGELDGRTWTARELTAVLRLGLTPVESPYGLVRLRVEVENRTAVGEPLRERADALRSALLSAHAVLALDGGAFVSLQDPPEWAADDAATCQQAGWWPCLAGPPGCRSIVLAAPIIVSDHPEVAPESPGDLYDATEIDEILTLRTLALTDDEKQEARATDPRAATLLDRVEGTHGDVLAQLHGTFRRPEPGPAPGSLPSTPWWDPEADASVDPGSDTVTVGGVGVRRGSRVLLRPGARRADAQDLFHVGRVAVVEAVLFDVDGQVHLAVTPDDDPAGDLVRGPGRFLFFAPDEVEPIGDRS